MNGKSNDFVVIAMNGFCALRDDPHSLSIFHSIIH